MKAFLIISICVITLSCGSYPKKNGFHLTESAGNMVVNPYFANTHHDYIYKASIDAFDHHFGGIFIVKKTGSQQHRIVFTTEMGNKLLDLSFDKDDFKVNYILEELNRKIIINILKNDFKALITESLPLKSTYIFDNETVNQAFIKNKVYYYYQNPEIYKISRVKHGKENVRFLFTEINDGIAQQIDIVHLNIKLRMSLKSLN
jgi:hypothetical protein